MSVIIHDGSQYTRSGDDGHLLPACVGNRHLGVRESKENGEKRTEWTGGGLFFGQPERQPGGGSLHNDG